MKKPDIVFEVSWEVCNKVGGIYTVLSSHAHTLLRELKHQNLIYIGPDLTEKGGNQDFTLDPNLLPEWKTIADSVGLPIKIGYWEVTSRPIAILIDFSSFFNQKDEIYAKAWNTFRVDSLHAYGDYDEASLFSYATGKLVELLYHHFLQHQKVIYQAHEWMSGMGLLYLQQHVPAIGTVFTTHATTVGRSITTNNKELYKYFNGYHGDQMAAELHVEAKHSIEKQSAQNCDCFTTVSQLTAKECTQLLDKEPDKVLPNGFDNIAVPKGSSYNSERRLARKKILQVASALFGTRITDKAMIISTSGRNDFRCKGYDLFLESVKKLNDKLKQAEAKETKIIALLEVPCWVAKEREDLKERLGTRRKKGEQALPNPFLTHELHNEWEDRILNTIHHLQIENKEDDPVKVILIPCYLDGNDGIFNHEYYQLLLGNDLCIYPSYYEPWGYTPLEACAYRIPCITTDLSGFGLWVNDLLKQQGSIEKGVEVIHRNDDNYQEVVNKIVDVIHYVYTADVPTRNKIKKMASNIALKAQWKNFIKYYFEAYDFALTKAQNRIKA